MAHRVALIPGDGIGPEVTDATLQVLDATGVEIAWERYDEVGQAAVDAHGSPLPDFVVDGIRKAGVALKGPVTTPVGKGFKSVNVQLRQKLDLYASVRPCRSTPGVRTPFDHVDLIIFRENTEGLYSGIENYDERLGIADSIARITRRGSERIIRFCFEYARRNKRKKVTLAHKANILKVSSGMFLQIGKDMAAEYADDVVFEDRIIDNMCMQLVSRPQNYDCIVTTNLFGDILSDLCAGLVGGLGIVAGANVGDDGAVFEAVHGSAPDIQGKNIANPTALIASAELMLRYLGEHAAADAIMQAVHQTFEQGRTITRDLGGDASTTVFAGAVAERVRALLSA